MVKKLGEQASASPMKYSPGKSFNKYPLHNLHEHRLQEVGQMAAAPELCNAEDKLICLIKTNEPHLKRAVERRSQFWTQNNKNSSAVYDVKFEFQDQP